MFAFSPYSNAFFEDPYPLYARLREEAPVYHNEAEGFWALSRHADVLAAFKDPKRFSNRYGVSLDRASHGDAARTGISFLALDPPEHTKFRSRVARGFTPRRVAALEPRIRELTVRSLDAQVGSGGFDAIGDFAAKLPMDVISEMMGVPEADRGDLRDAAETMLHREEGVFDVPPEGIAAFGRIRAYFKELLARLRREPGADLLSALLELGELDEDELLAFSNLMITAGNETTTKLLGHALYWLWRNPAQRAKVAAEPAARIPDWIEETLRYDNSTQALMRFTLEKVELRGTSIPAGERVLLLVGSGNRDPEVFERPDEFDIERDTSELLSFGRGTHFCMGAALARLEARVALEEWWKRFPDYRVREEGTARVHSINVRGFAALPVEV